MHLELDNFWLGVFILSCLHAAFDWNILYGFMILSSKLTENPSRFIFAIAKLVLLLTEFSIGCLKVGK